MKRPISLTIIRNERRKADAKHMRRMLFDRARYHCDFLADDIQGFALVSWGRDASIAGSHRIGPDSWVNDATLSHVVRQQLEKAILRDAVLDIIEPGWDGKTPS